MLIGFLSFTSFNINSKEKKKRETIGKITKPAIVKNNTSVTIPFLQKDFVGFKEAIAFKESQGYYRTVNKYGYLGKYQFGKSTLHRLKIYNTQHFLRNPKLQEDAFKTLCKVNKWILRRDIKRFEGLKMNGVVVTESGILAAAHLAGAGNVKKYLRTYGKYQFSDAFGTSIYDYIKKFAGYDVSNIQAIKNATL